jgi:DNA-binding transcriptional regulator YhcF (GntR family)
MDQNIDIPFSSNVPKYISIAEAITDSVRVGKLSHGQQLPSINEFSASHFISRDTIEKAYKELRRQGIIESVKGKGYFITGTNTGVLTRVLVMFNKISNYKKQIYNSFVKTLGENAKVDLQIHHWNVQILKSIIDKSLHQYDYFVIMPHFYENHEEAIEAIKLIPKGKLILLDKDVPELGNDLSSVYQDFRNDIIGALESAKPYLRKYDKLVYVNPDVVPYPAEIVNGFKYFCEQNDLDYSILGDMDQNIPVSRGEAYIVIEEMDLANLIKICKSHHLKIGKDIGIISYNDTPLKEILLDGITVISTDHERMGKSAANIILNKQQVKIKNPFTLILRKSL